MASSREGVHVTGCIHNAHRVLRDTRIHSGYEQGDLIRLVCPHGCEDVTIKVESLEKRPRAGSPGRTLTP